MWGNQIRQVQSAARILLICPDCGHETAEFADTLRGMRTVYCAGDDCDFIFDLAGPRRDFGGGFAEGWKRLCAAIYGMRRSWPRPGVR